MPLGGYRAAVVATLGARDTVPVLRCWDVLIRQVEGERGGESAILGGRRSGEVIEQVEKHEVLVARWRAIERLVLQFPFSSWGGSVNLCTMRRRSAYKPGEIRL